MESTDTRLIRMEEKIDSLAEAMITLARVEERLAASNDRASDMHEKINCLESEIRRLSRLENKSEGKALIWERMAWIVITVAMGLFSLQ